MLNILNHLSKTLTRSNGWSTYFAIFISIGQLFLFNSAVAGTTFIIDTDNIKNDFSGPADNDLDTVVLDSDLIYPIEPSINVTGAAPISTARLVIYANSIDEESNELASVFLWPTSTGKLSW
jgi:hypothetical protein